MSDQPSVELLRAEMTARLAGLEKWLERTTIAVERLTENRDRILILETRFEEKIEQLSGEHTAIRKSIDEVRRLAQAASQANAGQEIRLAKLDLFKAAVVFLAGAAAVEGIKFAIQILSKTGGA